VHKKKKHETTNEIRRKTMKAVAESKIMQKSHLIVAVSAIAVFGLAGVARAMSDVQDVVAQLQQIVDDNPGTPLADKAEDAHAKLETALDELAKTPPDCQAAVGNIEGAVGDLEAAVKDGLLDADQGTEMMNLLTCAAWQLAVGAIYQAIDCEADEDEIADGEQALAEGDQLWLAGAYKDAVNKYKDALAKAEGEVSDAIDPLAELTTQDLVSEDDKVLGKAILYYDESADATDIRLKSWGLEPDTQYTVLLCECEDGEVTDCVELGSLTTNGKGKGCLHARVGGDKSHWCVVVGTVDGRRWVQLAKVIRTDDYEDERIAFPEYFIWRE
jgi:hypothetical protein